MISANRVFMVVFRTADPVPPLDPGSHSDMLCRKIICINTQKEILGHGGGNTPQNKLECNIFAF